MLESKIPADSKVLVVCASGVNRSPTLAWYLENQGYMNVSYGGVGYRAGEPRDDGGIGRKVTQTEVDEADWIISVDNQVTALLRKQYEVGQKQIVQLNLNDFPTSTFIPGVWNFSNMYPYLKNIENICKDSIGRYLAN